MTEGCTGKCTGAHTKHTSPRPAECPTANKQDEIQVSIHRIDSDTQGE